MQLTKWNEAKKAISEAYKIDEVALIRNKAEAARYALIQAKESPEVIRQAEEIKLRAERRAGKILKETPKQHGARPADTGSQAVTPLKELGITKNQSSKWQQIADIPEDEFEEFIEKTEQITTAGAVKLSKKLNRYKPIKNIKPIPEDKYNVIYADPPWKYDHERTDSRKIENQYPTMTLEDIKKIKIPCSNDCVLFLWATAPKLEEALSVMNAWGFAYKTFAIWDKEIIGMGYWFRGQHEALLVGVKGNVTPPDTNKRVNSVYTERRGKHSKKPDYYYGLIENMFPEEKYLELFARHRHNSKWTVWGNEV